MMSKVYDLEQERASRTTIDGVGDLELLIDSFGSHNTDPSRPFIGQPHTDQGERGKAEVSGIRFRDLADCLVRAFALSSGEGPVYSKAKDGTLTYNDLYLVKDFDPIAVVQNLSCEVEKMMGIFPNLPDKR